MGQNEEPAQRTVCPGNQNLIIYTVIRKTGQPSEFLFTEKDCASKRRGHIWFKQIRPPIAVEAAPAMVLTSKLQGQYTINNVVLSIPYLGVVGKIVQSAVEITTNLCVFT